MVRSGIATFTFRHFAFLGEESLDAALAAECAADQDRFFPYHDYLYANQAGARDSGAFEREVLFAIGEAAGLDMSAFESCVDARTHAAAIAAGMDEARSLGVRGTPAVFINGEMVSLGTPADFLAQVRAALP